MGMIVSMSSQTNIMCIYWKIQSVFELSDGSGLAVTVTPYEASAHTNIDKVLNWLYLIPFSRHHLFFLFFPFLKRI